MSYLEKKGKKGTVYVSFVKKVSFMGENFLIKKYIGKGLQSLDKDKYVMDNLDIISNEELTFRKKFLGQIKKNISHNENLAERIELKSIKINNLIEGKRCRSSLDLEFIKEFIFNSNNIEGSKIPPERVREIIDTGDTKYQNRNEVKEVKNSITSFDYLQKSFKFNTHSIKRLYHILTKDLFMEGNIPYPKGFKKEPVIVGNSHTTPPEKVEEELKSLLKWYRDNKNKIHPLILALEFHKRYEFIHPFRDGNGRTGRLIMNKILLSAGYYPIIVYKLNKLAYFNAIEKSKEGRLKNYYQFMLEQADKTYEFLLETIKRY
ncbi:Fic family protein [Candidatus Woesearchaeota archaeon]|nr:Fic family protein [Candidatus Woesearchaeota archaeon]